MSEAIPDDQPFAPPQADVPLEADSIERCPRCPDMALDTGFIQSALSISWYTRKPRFLTIIGERGILISKAIGNGYIPAQRCPRCALILVQGDPG